MNPILLPSSFSTLPQRFQRRIQIFKQLILSHCFFSQLKMRVHSILVVMVELVSHLVPAGSSVHVQLDSREPHVHRVSSVFSVFPLCASE